MALIDFLHSCTSYSIIDSPLHVYGIDRYLPAHELSSALVEGQLQYTQLIDSHHTTCTTFVVHLLLAFLACNIIQLQRKINNTIAINSQKTCTD